MVVVVGVNVDVRVIKDVAVYLVVVVVDVVDVDVADVVVVVDDA